MKKYEETIPDYDVVLSTRVRYARNIEDYPFDLSFSRAMGNELVERVRNSLGNEFLEQKMGQLSAADRLCLCESRRNF